MQKHVLVAISLCAGISVISCAPRSFDAGKDAEVASITMQDYSKLFSEEDIKKIFVEASATNPDGSRKSAAPIVSTFGPENAPKYFNEQYTRYTHGSETRAFLNLGKAPDAAAQAKYIGKLESVSAWKSIKHADGKPVFEDAYSLDIKTNEQAADTSDGRAPVAPGEQHTLRMVLKKSFLTLKIDGGNWIANSGGFITMSFKNTNNVNAPLVGAIIKPNGFKMDVYAFPYKHGWLVYGATAVRIEELSEMYKPEMVSNIMTAMFNWLAQ